MVSDEWWLFPQWTDTDADTDTDTEHMVDSEQLGLRVQLIELYSV
jgi:hypothetical protein